MGQKKTVHMKRRIYLWYTASFLFVAGIVFCQLPIFHKTLVWNVDGYLQWHAFFSKFQDVATDFFSGKGFSFWSWDFGLGADFFSNFGHVVFDPFNYVALLFPKQYLDVAYTLAEILRFYVAGMAMLCFLHYHKKENLLCLIGAIGYAFCTWALVCTRQGAFLTQMVIFPLLILGIDKVEDGRSPLTLIFSVCFSVLNNIYFSYVSALFIVIYIVIRYFTMAGGEKSFHGFVHKILKYMFYAITGGVLLTAPFLLPSFYTLLSCSKESGVDIQLLPNLVKILRFVPAFAGSLDVNSNDSIVGMNILFVLMLPAIFQQCRKKSVSCRMFIICLPFVLIPGLQSVTNGFSYPSGRWSYILAFFFVYAAIECLEWESIYTGKYKRALVFLLSGIAGWSFIACVVFRVCNTAEFIIIMLNIFFAIICCYILYESQSSKKSCLRWLFATVMINVAVMGFAFFNPMVRNNVSIYMTQGMCDQIYSNSNLRAASAIEDSEFYRVDTVDSPSNADTNLPFVHMPVNLGIYWGVSSPTVYLSTLDGNWLKYNQQLGNNSGYSRRVCSFSNDNRSRIDFLQGIKYFLGNDRNRDDKIFSQYAGYGFSESQTEQGVSILKSPYNVSLGYVYDMAISEQTFAEYTPLEREQLLMQCAVLSEDDLKRTEQVKQAESDKLEWESSVSVPYQISASDGINLTEYGFETWKRATFTLEEEEKDMEPGELYLVFHNLQKKPFNRDRFWEIAYPTKDRLTRASFLLNGLMEQSYGNISMIITRDNLKKKLLNAEGENQAIRNINDYIINLGYVTDYGEKINCAVETPGEYSYDSIELISVPLKKYEKQAENLTANRLHVTSCKGDYIAGEVDTIHGGLLYLSVLYNEGWKIYIDGKETEHVYRVDTAFTGVEVTPGKHKIELRYQPVGMPYTFVFPIIGVAIIILVSIRFSSQHSDCKQRNIKRDALQSSGGLTQNRIKKGKDGI